MNKQEMLEILSQNVKTPKQKFKLAIESGISSRTIEYALNGNRNIKYETLFRLLQNFGYEIEIQVRRKDGR